ncbi:HAD-IB family phosphatase [Sphingomonas sp. 1P06PA]|uniref:HAD family hydrolase n=1 Tax=Sphingomonas sp. 1P06PA TaxID=554121 RepID=UPI0039A68D19
MQRIAIYDMDKTITVHPTYARFLAHAARALAPWRLALAPLSVGPGLAYLAKAIDRGRLKEINQRLLLGRHLDPAELAGVVTDFARTTLATNIRPGALARIADERAAGYRMVLATASYRLYAEAIGRAAGFDDVIATASLAGLDGRLRPKIDGENCYGPAKLRMVQAWLEAQGIARSDAHIRFYSDHVSDAPVLEWADEGYAVHPSPALAALAATKGWPVMDWGTGSRGRG